MRLRKVSPDDPDLMSQEIRRQQTRRYTRLLRWYSTIVFGQLVIAALSESFRVSESSAALKNRSRLRRVQGLAEEQAHNAKSVEDDKRQRELLEICNRERKEEHRQRMARYGLPEDASLDDLREYHRARQQEREEYMSAMKAEGKVLDSLLFPSNNDIQEKIATLRAYCAEHPSTEIGHGRLISALRDAGHYYEAVHLAKRQIEDAERDSVSKRSGVRRSVAVVFMLKHLVGKMLVDMGEPQEAVEHLEQCISEKKRKGEDTLEDALLPLMYLTLGDAYRGTGDIAKAREAWEEVLRQHRPVCWTDMSDGACEKEARERLKENTARLIPY